VRPDRGRDDHLDDGVVVPSETNGAAQAIDGLTTGERDKLAWLLGLVRGLDRAQKAFNRAKPSFVFEHGIAVDRSFDWIGIRNRLFPELAIVMVGDGGKSIYDYPQYAIVPRLGIYIDLQAEIPADKTQQGKPDSVLAALNVLESYAKGLSGSKAGNAERQIQILKRIVGSGT